MSLDEKKFPRPGKKISGTTVCEQDCAIVGLESGQTNVLGGLLLDRSLREEHEWQYRESLHVPSFFLSG
ncbi:hypothetical protein AVEN_234731-1 [Araneus ventricosus]|uniref:Uncharacterized protein n=1 Tax=Araneus ventricosus TaxID=182803 RepID=A0A4Y2R237_ARAVE|nr:hypothetical protein AVEN_234731-1 [Araneus ventricosus]